MDAKWLKDICAAKFERPALSEPMIVERDERTFVVATDGQRLVELAGHYGEFQGPPDGMMPSMLRILAPTPGAALPFSYPALRGFLRDALKGVVRTCSTCDDEGWVTVVRWRTPFYEPCPKCDRAVTYPKHVYIGGTLFNARLFEPFIENLPEVTTARWYQERKTTQALTDGGQWRFIVMPLREDAPEELTTAPRFEIEGAEAKAA